MRIRKHEKELLLNLEVSLPVEIRGYKIFSVLLNALMLMSIILEASYYINLRGGGHI